MFVTKRRYEEAEEEIEILRKALLKENNRAIIAENDLKDVIRFLEEIKDDLAILILKNEDNHQLFNELWGNIGKYEYGSLNPELNLYLWRSGEFYSPINPVPKEIENGK